MTGSQQNLSTPGVPQIPADRKLPQELPLRKFPQCFKGFSSVLAPKTSH